jgi:hypothetical protein
MAQDSCRTQGEGMSPATATAAPARSDLLLLVLHVALGEDPHAARGHALERFLQRLAANGVGASYFSGARARRALLEGLANLEQNGLVRIDTGGLEITQDGLQRVTDLTADKAMRLLEDGIRETAERVSAG